jgi:hypothetical protein
LEIGRKNNGGRRGSGGCGGYGLLRYQERWRRGRSPWQRAAAPGVALIPTRQIEYVVLIVLITKGYKYI